MKSLQLFSLFIAVLIITACHSHEKEEKVVNEQEEEIVEKEELTAPHEADLPEAVKHNEEEEVVVPADEPKEKEEQQSSLTFCDCIKKQKAINDQIAVEESDSGLEKLLDEMDVLQKGPCSDLLSGAQASPEQREERQRKVKSCLR